MQHSRTPHSLPILQLVYSLAIRAGSGLCGVTHAAAEPVPLPTVDFEVKATMMSSGTMTMHHSGDKARVETDVGPLPLTGIMDLKTRKMYMLMSIPGIGNTAMEVSIGDASYGQVYGDGKRVGNDTVAGEPCELWEMAAAKPGHESKHFGGPVIVCLSKDHIPLRTEATVNGKRKVVSEVTEIKRVKQDPSLFVLPKGVKTVKMPKSLSESIAAGIAKEK
jgi:hypothetical protein